MRLRLRLNPQCKITVRGNSSVGRAQPCQGWGREFESRFPLQIFLFQIYTPTLNDPKGSRTVRRPVLISFPAPNLDVHHLNWKRNRIGRSVVCHPNGVPSSRLSFPAPNLIHRYLCGNSSVGRAQSCQGWGRERYAARRIAVRFESRFPLQIFLFQIYTPTLNDPKGSRKVRRPVLVSFLAPNSHPFNTLRTFNQGNPA